MKKAKIGKREGTGLADGQANARESSDRELWEKMLEFQKELTQRLAAEGALTAGDYDSLVNIEE